MMSNEQGIAAQESSKYYTPDIEDIRVGYECEVYGQTTTKLIKNVDFHKVIVGLHMEVGQKVGINQIPNLLKKGYIKVPYLTKEQIENEGWRMVWNEGNSIVYEKDELVITTFIGFKRIKINYKSGYQLFDGICPSINEFRQIIKLLNI